MPKARTRSPSLFGTTCRNCHKRYRWTKSKCPKCMLRNANHPAILFGKVLAVAALVAALWFFAHAFVKTDDTASGVIPPSAERATTPKPMIPMPKPDRTRDPFLPR